jgi:death on curing protein
MKKVAPAWVPLQAITTIHDRQIARHGGAPGMRDPALIAMECGRPLNLFAYGEPSLEELAAAYASGIAKARAFVDGNKRTAFVAAIAFLRLNKLAFRPDPAEGVRMMADLAASRITEAEFASWLASGRTGL